MKRKLVWISALVLLCLALGGSDCIMDEKVIELVVYGSACVPFDEDHQSQTWTTEREYDVAGELDRILADHGYSRDDIKGAQLISVTYQVTDPPVHDWQVSGTIAIEYPLGEDHATMVNYTIESLDAATDAPVYADLNAAGVSVFNDAVADYLPPHYLDPVVTFWVENGAVTPEPGPADPIVFSWEACIKMYLKVERKYNLPDPF
jgi:hypothetical protein